MCGSLEGEILIAAEHLRDQNFYRTVVLVLEDNVEGAMGLVVNRPSSITVDAALSSHSKTSVDAPVFMGGPVENSALFILHNFVQPGLQDREIAPGLFVVSRDESLQVVVDADSNVKATGIFRVYCGYAGWGAQQLELEIDRGDWHKVAADCETVLEVDPYGMWEVCTRRFRRAHRILPHNVRNPEWN